MKFCLRALLAVELANEGKPSESLSKGTSLLTSSRNFLFLFMLVASLLEEGEIVALLDKVGVDVDVDVDVGVSSESLVVFEIPMLLPMFNQIVDLQATLDAHPGIRLWCLWLVVAQ